MTVLWGAQYVFSQNISTLHVFDFCDQEKCAHFCNFVFNDQICHLMVPTNGYFSYIVLVKKFQKAASVQNNIKIYILLHFCSVSVSNGGLKSSARIFWGHKYTWICLFGESQIIMEDKNHLGDSYCCGTELCFMGNEKQCYQWVSLCF